MDEQNDLQPDSPPGFVEEICSSELENIEVIFSPVTSFHAKNWPPKCNSPSLPKHPFCSLSVPSYHFFHHFNGYFVAVILVRMSCLFLILLIMDVIHLAKIKLYVSF